MSPTRPSMPAFSSGKRSREPADIAGDVAARHADVVLGIDDPVQDLVGDEGDVLDLREAREEVKDAVALADRGRVQGRVEDEARRDGRTSWRIRPA